MCVYHLLTGRPGKDGEAAILRSHQRNGIALILDKLCGGQMARPAELFGVYDGCCRANHGFRQHHALDANASFAADNLSAECQQLILLTHQRCPIYRRESRHGSDGAGKSGLLGMLAGGMMGGPLAAVSKLSAAGLSMDQIKILGTITLDYAKERAGSELVKQVAGSIPGLSGYV